MALTFEPIARAVTGASTSTITFTSIPATYTDIVIKAVGLSTSGNLGWGMQFNSDTASNYNATYVEGNGISTVASERYPSNLLRVGWNSYWVSSGWTAYNEVHLQSYANTGVWKTALFHNNSSTYIEAGVGTWRSTAAINRIDITATSSTFAAGTVFSLYGIKAA